MNTERSDDENPTGEESLTWAEACEYTRRQALIEQAKGMLMFVYGIDADEAFTVLRTQSQDHNIKLRLIAEQVVKDMVELARDTKGPARRRAFDGVMLTAHQRIANVADRQLDGQSKTGVQMKDLGNPPNAIEQRNPDVTGGPGVGTIATELPAFGANPLR